MELYFAPYLKFLIKSACKILCSFVHFPHAPTFESPCSCMLTCVHRCFNTSPDFLTSLFWNDLSHFTFPLSSFIILLNLPVLIFSLSLSLSVPPGASPRQAADPGWHRHKQADQSRHCPAWSCPLWKDWGSETPAGGEWNYGCQELGFCHGAHAKVQ